MSPICSIANDLRILKKVCHPSFHLQHNRQEVRLKVRTPGLFGLPRRFVGSFMQDMKVMATFTVEVFYNEQIFPQKP